MSQWFCLHNGITSFPWPPEEGERVRECLEVASEREGGTSRGGNRILDSVICSVSDEREGGILGDGIGYWFLLHVQDVARK